MANEMRSKVMNIYFSNDRSLQQSPFTEFFFRGLDNEFSRCSSQNV